MMSNSISDSLPPDFNLFHKLEGHRKSIFKISISSDGRRVASPSEDGTIRLWDIENGTLLRILRGSREWIVCAVWSPDDRRLVTDFNENTIRVWNPDTGKVLNSLEGHENRILCLAFSPNGRVLASGSWDQTIRLWNMETFELIATLKEHKSGVYSLAWSPDGKMLCSGSIDDTIRIWNVAYQKSHRVLSGHSSNIGSIAWSPDGKYIASASLDKTIKIWDSTNGRHVYNLEAHTAEISYISFMSDGKLLGSMGTDGRIIIWRSDRWVEVARTCKMAESYGSLSNPAFHPTLPVLAIQEKIDNNIYIIGVDINNLLRTSVTQIVQYLNAKAVLVGDSGVGKSGLGIKMAENEFRPTISTHGAQFWQIPIPEGIVGDKEGIKFKAELTLWDFAGQPEYRLVHQLFLDGTDVALILFDCSDSNDPFRGVHYWAKALKKQAQSHIIKFLVSSRCDVSPVTVDRSHINATLNKYELHYHTKSSAKTGEGVKELLEQIFKQIPWDNLPRSTRPELFQVIRELILEYKEKTIHDGENNTLVPMEIIKQELTKRYTKHEASQDEIDTVLAFQQVRGFIYKLNPHHGKVFILMKPELINQYSSSIIQAARKHPDGIGVILERDVLTGNFDLGGVERLVSEQERFILDCTAELLIQYDICFREMGYLTFPSQINLSKPNPIDKHPRTEVTYRFSGSIEMIYASLVVRMSYTAYFQLEQKWKYAAEFSINEARLGFSMQQIEEGTGVLEIYFDNDIKETDRVVFIRFITAHLDKKGVDIEEQIRLYCPSCRKEIDNRKAIASRLKAKKMDISCQYCDTKVIIPNSIEQHYSKEPSLVQINDNLNRTVKERTNEELKIFIEDKQEYTKDSDPDIHILHLSDIHIKHNNEAQKYRMQLQTDLKRNLRVNRLEYLIISGDIGSYSTIEEYQGAYEFVDGIVKRFGLDAERVMIVPGNHDINWDLSEKAYPFIPQSKMPNKFDDSHIIPAGSAGVLLRDEDKYHERFRNFSLDFYKRVFIGREYPLRFDSQFDFVVNTSDRILILGLNTCWQIDHYFKNRAGINMGALTKALDKLIDVVEYEDCLKIAVWHHPVTGREMIDDAFLQLLAEHDFTICMHGHIHEAGEGFYKHDDKRGIHIIGAGTFGAAADEQVPGIPHQYNLLTYYKDQRKLKVQTRKKEKPNGAWGPDSRWGDRENPKPFYEINLR